MKLLSCSSLIALLFALPRAIAETCGSSVTGFLLWTSSEDNNDGPEPYLTLAEGAKIKQRTDLKLNVEAIIGGDDPTTCSHTVEFELEGALNMKSTEKKYPYFLFANQGDFIYGKFLPPGGYRLRARVDGQYDWRVFEMYFSIRKECSVDEDCSDNYDCTKDTCMDYGCEYEFQCTDTIDVTRTYKSCVSVNSLLIHGSSGSSDDFGQGNICFSVPSNTDCPNVAIAESDYAYAFAGEVEGDSCNYAIATGGYTGARASHGIGNKARVDGYKTEASARDGNYNTASGSGAYGSSWSGNGNYNTAISSGDLAKAQAVGGDHNVAMVAGDSSSAFAGNGDDNLATVVCPNCDWDDDNYEPSTQASASGQRNIVTVDQQDCIVTVDGGNMIEKHC